MLDQYCSSYFPSLVPMQVTKQELPCTGAMVICMSTTSGPQRLSTIRPVAFKVGVFDIGKKLSVQKELLDVTTILQHLQ